MTAIWWIRRDFRLHDNPALQAALEQGPVLPVFILDERLLESAYVGRKRLDFLFAGLHVLDQDLRTRGGRLILRQGEPITELQRLLDESGAQQIYAEPDYSPFARRRDRRAEAKLPLTWCGSPVVQPPGSVLKSDGDPYTVFTPFSKVWLKQPAPGPGGLLPAPKAIPAPPAVESLPLPEATPSELFPAGEAEALRRLAAFSKGRQAPVYTYGDGRNLLDSDGTSKLSPYLRFGMVSARQAVVAARQALAAAPDAPARKSAQSWLNELIWREFYLHILYHFPHVRRQNFRLPDLRWENDPEAFQAWRQGRTGYPVVDAAMRQLQASGWMHNRARMIVASFLTKDLLIDWRWGERWFMQQLIDGDPAANNGGWQWTAGTGTDAAPYFRIFNPITQSKKFDPKGAFIRRWLPELAGVPAQLIHEPWRMSPEEQSAAGCRIGVDYPAPIIEHAWARERALAVYGQA